MAPHGAGGAQAGAPVGALQGDLITLSLLPLGRRPHSRTLLLRGCFVICARLALSQLLLALGLGTRQNYDRWHLTWSGTGLNWSLRCWWITSRGATTLGSGVLSSTTSLTMPTLRSYTLRFPACANGISGRFVNAVGRPRASFFPLIMTIATGRSWWRILTIR